MVSSAAWSHHLARAAAAAVLALTALTGPAFAQETPSTLPDDVQQAVDRISGLLGGGSFEFLAEPVDGSSLPAVSAGWTVPASPASGTVPAHGEIVVVLDISPPMSGSEITEFLDPQNWEYFDESGRIEQQTRAWATYFLLDGKGADPQGLPEPFLSRALAGRARILEMQRTYEEERAKTTALDLPPMSPEEQARLTGLMPLEERWGGSLPVAGGNGIVAEEAGVSGTTSPASPFSLAGLAGGLPGAAHFRSDASWPCGDRLIRAVLDVQDAGLEQPHVADPGQTARALKAWRGLAQSIRQALLDALPCS